MVRGADGHPGPPVSRMAGLLRLVLPAFRQIAIHRCSATFFLADGKTNETTRLRALSQGNWSRITAPVYDMIAMYTETSFTEAASTSALFAMVAKVSDLAEFRSKHVSLWLAAALDIPADSGSGDSMTSILGPNPKKYSKWLAAMGVDIVKHFEDVSAHLAEAQKHIPWFEIDWNFYHYQFAVCKFVQLVEFLVYAKKSQTLEWRIVSAALDRFKS
ncbi:unnamed protein product [Prorocentrum cordatum]|uniref:Uncharacterized protein n=1 Tax=Prorocentrum cordatum TaxID=2364126 RepID=A0ABN9UIR6_9DINO|nr:unnamed protein product [Polarella glacialis]